MQARVRGAIRARGVVSNITETSRRGSFEVIKLQTHPFADAT